MIQTRLYLYVSNEIAEKVQNGLNKEYEALIDVNNQPKYSLCAFKRVSLKAGESKVVDIKVAPLAFTSVLEDGSRVTLKGEYTLFAGGGQPDLRTSVLTGNTCLKEKVTI